MRRWLLGLVLLAVMSPAPARAAHYELANHCYDFGHGPVRAQATALGRYLFYTRDGKYLSGPDLAPADAPGPTGDYTVGDDFSLKPQSGDAPAGTFTFKRVRGCAVFPNADTDVDGKPSKRKRAWAPTRGLIDSHMHWMAADMFGGDAHCGRAWSPYGIAVAMTDCPDHKPGGAGLEFENLLSGNSPSATHDTVGWPTFKDWPNPTSLTHENTYYKWVERAYRGGLRLAVVLFFDNGQLCSIWPERAHDCDEMATVRREVQQLKDLRAYVDAQSGGPGKGWFKIVRTPFQARRVINRGKLAVVMGIETSRLFDCRVQDDVPACTDSSIDQQLTQARAEGIRSLEITGKFDNALAGVAGDPGTNGIVTNLGNKLETGSFLRMQTCKDLPSGVTDKTQITSGLPDLGPLGLTGATPAYPPAPHCNQLGLSDLGKHLINRMVDTHTILDPDHMSAISRIAALDIAQQRGYSGLISSHSWSTPVDEARIFSLGGVVFPKASAIGQSSNTDWFTSEYARVKKERAPGYQFGFGYGSDVNGIAKQPTSGPDPHVTYPFTSYDGKQTLRQLTTGQRVWDFNTDGVANYGLYLDWLEELRQRLGKPFVHDMLRGPEAYLDMWERAYGVPATLAKRPRKGWTALQLLKRSGQPRKRGARVWRYPGVKVTLSRHGRVARVQ